MSTCNHCNHNPINAKSPQPMILSMVAVFKKKHETGFEPATPLNVIASNDVSRMQAFWKRLMPSGSNFISNTIKKVILLRRTTFFIKRETGFEPATLALARRCSTTEPLARIIQFCALKHINHYILMH